MTDNAHALLSASGAHRWATCAASLRLESTYPRSSSKYAAEGTAAHTLGSWALAEGKHPRDYPDAEIEADGMTFKVTKEMIEAVAFYVDLVREYAKGGELLVEQKVDYSIHLGVPDSFGTSDAVILHEERLTIVDLKYGMGVKVDADDNEQLMLYALGALYEYEMLGDFREVVMVICQPRLQHVSEFTLDVTSLKTFALRMKAAALKAIAVHNASEAPALDHFQPSDKGCRFCKAQATCPALAADVQHETRDLFASIVPAEIPEDKLAQAMSKVGMIESFCKAIRAEAERRLLAGQSVQGFKLVRGRRGARQWVSEDNAEALMKSFRLKQEDMYSFKLLSPTQMEKGLKDKNPKRWAKLEKLVEQPDGQLSVAPEDDKRPAVSVSSAVDGFAALAAPVDESEFV